MSEVQFDQSGLQLQLGAERTGFRWDQVSSIVFRTTSDGPWADDQFFLFEKQDGTVCSVPFSLSGAGELVGVIASLDCSKAEEWLFSSWTSDRSVVVWESSPGGKSLACRIGEVMAVPRSKSFQPPVPEEFAAQLLRKLMWKEMLWPFRPLASFAAMVRAGLRSAKR